ncbi:hypothetical protein [Caballeronia hypogeia]|uniref:hypothetical protein n=1 Tax=Caballeronia hypogeia TaxID=1777140 RepID=UPI0012FD6859|nr:hypothetical protein [Caballeronia hypogeia]
MIASSWLTGLVNRHGGFIDSFEILIDVDFSACSKKDEDASPLLNPSFWVPRAVQFLPFERVLYAAGLRGLTPSSLALNPGALPPSTTFDVATSVDSCLPAPLLIFDAETSAPQGTRRFRRTGCVSWPSRRHFSRLTGSTETGGVMSPLPNTFHASRSASWKR